MSTQSTDWSVREIAEQMGVTRQCVNRLIEKYGIPYRMHGSFMKSIADVDAQKLMAMDRPTGIHADRR
jgi:excisionase family DNA binding protein